MIYVMSDLHGCYEKYNKMLSLVDLKENDTLYILGDIVDRGPDGIKILLDLIYRKNVVALRGNHDHKAGIMLNRLMKPKDSIARKQFEKQFRSWISDGGQPTYESFLRLEEEEQVIILNYIMAMPFYRKADVAGCQYLLAHTVPEKEKMPVMPELCSWCSGRDYILGEPDYDEVYFDDVTIVTGHTPTALIDKNFAGKIWKGNSHIAVDCGAVYGNPLGCICLDTMKEFYVE